MKSIGKLTERFLSFIDVRYGVSLPVEDAPIVVAVIGLVAVGATALSGASQ